MSPLNPPIAVVKLVVKLVVKPLNPPIAVHQSRPVVKLVVKPVNPQIAASRPGKALQSDLRALFKGFTWMDGCGFKGCTTVVKPLNPQPSGFKGFTWLQIAAK